MGRWINIEPINKPLKNIKIPSFQERYDAMRREILENKEVQKFLAENNTVVTKEMIEKRLKHTIETTTQDEFVDLVGIFNSLKDKQSSVVDWFEQPKQKAELNILLDAEDDKEGANWWDFQMAVFVRLKK